ncbi:MAG: Uncharacterized protein CEO22_289 [Candidatus Berkelbacteria bacterium Gr01-1014_85]|uniref:Uncharacterized protein n=1 Tax=Candidatus Berkelbacteria bacterium Gr01-1014_85 TaxID=2017150 RepID=A0A554JC47_9BACT|nr:MAG: Uncharacterized protein CEO22_289 [Candidatus Berkelbacteria bacterium Gr01-1014_85]
MLKKAIIVALVLLALLFTSHLIFGPKDEQKTDEFPFITANFVNPAKIAAISKFRSCQGHIVVPQDGLEPRSNMKHYFYLKHEFTQSRRQVELYAPFDGFVSDIYEGDADFSDRNPASRDVTVSKRKGLTARSDWGLTFLHIEPESALKEGQRVKAGDLLGYVSLELIPPYYAFDIVYAKLGMGTKRVDNWNSPYKALDSAFNHMSDQVLAEYALLGGRQPSDFVIEPAIRQAEPCQYGSDGRSFDRQKNRNFDNDWRGNIQEAITDK